MQNSFLLENYKYVQQFLRQPIDLRLHIFPRHLRFDMYLSANLHHNSWYIPWIQSIRLDMLEDMPKNVYKTH